MRLTWFDGIAKLEATSAVSYAVTARDGHSADLAGNRGSAEVGEEELHLARGGLGRVGAVHDVRLHLEGEVAADRPGRRLHRIGGAGQCPERLDRPRSLDDEGHQRAAGDELDQRGEERPLAVLGV